MVASKGVLFLATALTAVTALPINSGNPSSLVSNKHVTIRVPGHGLNGGLQLTGSMKKPHTSSNDHSTRNERDSVPGVDVEKFLVPQLRMYF
ncbi:hypothetical protein ONS96_011351 [Cadophora gregata f. sp. sojae]|nr:hypothetical protein ONS96_011351 [Cadophora gregata f. sp. sojae]